MIIKINIDYVKKRLDRSDRTYEWLAERTGLSASYIYRLMRGVHLPGAETRRRIRTVLRAKWDDIFIIEE